MSGIDTVCIDDNFTLLSLTEEFSQAHRGNHPTTQQVTQHVPRSNRGQLVGVTYQQQMRFTWQSFEQMIKEQDIDHRELIDDHKLIRQRIIFIALIGIVMRSVFQQPMQRFRLRLALNACCFRETLGCSSRRCCEGEIEDRKSTRLNSSHEWISYAVFC